MDIRQAANTAGAGANAGGDAAATAGGTASVHAQMLNVFALAVPSITSQPLCKLHCLQPKLHPHNVLLTLVISSQWGGC
jgi:hypothetical protein